MLHEVTTHAVPAMLGKKPSSWVLKIENAARGQAGLPLRGSGDHSTLVPYN